MVRGVSSGLGWDGCGGYGPVNRLLLGFPLVSREASVSPSSVRQTGRGSAAGTATGIVSWVGVPRCAMGCLGRDPLRREARELQLAAVRCYAPVQWNGVSCGAATCGKEGWSRHMRRGPGRWFVEAVAAGQGSGSLSLACRRRMRFAGRRESRSQIDNPGIHPALGGSWLRWDSTKHRPSPRCFRLLSACGPP